MRRVDKVITSQIGRALCVNCDTRWGGHNGIRCLMKNGTFKPIGFELSDICSNCGQKLQDHGKRVYCNNGLTIFKRKVQFLKDEDFFV